MAKAPSESCITSRERRAPFWESAKKTATESKWWGLLSASWLRDSWKLPRCQPISPHLYEEQAQHLLFLIVPVVAGVISKSPGSLQGCFCWRCESKHQKECRKSHFPEQSRNINSRDFTSQKPWPLSSQRLLMHLMTSQHHDPPSLTLLKRLDATKCREVQMLLKFGWPGWSPTTVSAFRKWTNYTKWYCIFKVWNDTNLPTSLNLCKEKGRYGPFIRTNICFHVFFCGFLF